MTLPETFWNKVIIPDNATDCWHWKGGHTSAGYGEIQIDGKIQLAHRAMYASVYGPLPPGQKQGVIDHLCRNRGCVKIEHLEFVSQSVNILRGRNTEVIRAKFALQATCKHGHDFTLSNTQHAVQSNGGTWRRCRACARARMAQFRARKKSMVAV